MSRNRLFYLTMMLISITMVLYGCDTGGKKSSNNTKTGTRKFILTGGAGTGGSGGSGGEGGAIRIDSLRSVSIKKSGDASTAFSFPGFQPSYHAGANKMEVASGQSVFVNAVAPGDAIPVGSFFMLYNSTSIQEDSDKNGIANSAAQDAIVNSIDIADGATVTLDMNIDNNNIDLDNSSATGGDRAEFTLSGDLRVAGTLTVGLLNSADGATDDETIVPSSADLYIDAANIFVTATGKVLAKGGDSAISDGGRGGYIWLGADTGTSDSYSNNGGYLKFNGICDASGGTATDAGTNGGNSGNCDLYSEGVAINTGNIYTNGGDGENGGYASWSNLSAKGTVYNTGNFYQHGGTGTNGNGGDADVVRIFSETSSVYTHGTIEIIGGDGTAAGGSVDNGVDIFNDSGYTGIIKISMTITARGGSSTSNGNGGNGGYFEASTYSGPVDIAGSFDGSGGDAMGTDNHGGNGSLMPSTITTFSYGELYSTGGPSNINRPNGDITVSMTFDLSGGDGYYGGRSSIFAIEPNIDSVTSNQEYTENTNPSASQVSLVGYENIDLSGGSCSLDCDGGQGGSIDINTSSYFLSDSAPYPTGAIVNNVPIQVNGGDGNGIGNGANAGHVYFSGDGESNDDTSIVKNTAGISLMGGAGNDGGSGGGIYMFAYGKVSNSGVLHLNGGEGTNNGGYGNNYSDSQLISVTDVVNSGKINAAGGNGDTGDGGGADNYSIIMYAGDHVKNSGQIIFRGGDGTIAGGNGGEIDIYSNASPSTNTAAINVKGGLDTDTSNGTSDGSNGHIFMDWMDITPPDGTL